MDLYQIIQEAADRHGVPYEGLLAIAQLESSMRPNARNRNSSASGLFQFTNATAGDYGLTGSRRNDPVAQADAAARMMRDNKRHMERRLGRQVTSSELYLAHQQGLGGATALLLNPNRPALDVLTSVYGNRNTARQAILNNGGNLNMTAGQFGGQWVTKADNAIARIPPRNLPSVATAQSTVPTPAANRGPVAVMPQTMSDDMRLMRNPTMSSTAARPVMRDLAPTLNPNGSVTMPGPMGDWATYNPTTGQFEARINTGPASVPRQSDRLAQQRAAAPASVISQPSHATAQRSRPAPVQRASLPPLDPPGYTPSRAPMPALPSQALSAARSLPSFDATTLAGLNSAIHGTPRPMPASIAAARSTSAPIPASQSASLSASRSGSRPAPPPPDNAFNRSFSSAEQVGLDPGLRTALNDYARDLAAGQPVYRPASLGGPNADRLTPNVQIPSPVPLPEPVQLVGMNHPRGAARQAFSGLMGVGGPLGPEDPLEVARRIVPRPMPASIALLRDPRMTGILPATMGGSRPIPRLPNVAMGFAPPRPVSAPVLLAPAAYQSASSSQSYHPHSSHSFFSGRDGADPYGGGGERYH